MQCTRDSLSGVLQWASGKFFCCWADPFVIKVRVVIIAGVFARAHRQCILLSLVAKESTVGC
jgi:hypothetical protein